MTLLDRAIDGLPIVGSLDKDVVVERTGGWSGAEIAVAVEEAMSRSLIDRTDALTNENLLAIVSERYVIGDPEVRRVVHSERVARHESAHAIEGWLRFGGRGAVALMSLRGGPAGMTHLDEERFAEIVTVAGFRDLAAMCLAGMAGEQIIYGADGVSCGSGTDQAEATLWLVRSRETARPYDREFLERGQASDRGSERMRGDLYAIGRRRLGPTADRSPRRTMPTRIPLNSPPICARPPSPVAPSKPATSS